MVMMAMVTMVVHLAMEVSEVVDVVVCLEEDERLSMNFSKVMQKGFEMSMLGELGFFLGLQISQKEDGIFISHLSSFHSCPNSFKLATRN